MRLLVYLILSHSQQGATDCIDKVKVDAALSKSYRVKGDCTFTPDSGIVEAISVSRVFEPSGEFGSITVNGITHHENNSTSGHIEPFAILPMWTTYSVSNVNVTGDVHVQLPVESLVSFGMAEDPALLMGGVIQDAYNAREWVYSCPALVMWLLHWIAAASAVWLLPRHGPAPVQNEAINLGTFAALPQIKTLNMLIFRRRRPVENDEPNSALLQITHDKEKIPNRDVLTFRQKFWQWWKALLPVDRCIVRWILLSLVIDVGVWGIWANVNSNSYGGGMYVVVTFFRIMWLIALFKMVCSKGILPFPSYVADSSKMEDNPYYTRKVRGFTFLVAAILSTYIAYAVLSKGNVVLGICIAVAVCTTGFAVLWPCPAFCLFISLIAIVLNLGAGLLAPICMYRWYTRVQVNLSHKTSDQTPNKLDMWQKTVTKYNQISLLVHFVSAIALVVLVHGNPEWTVCTTTPHTVWVPVNANQTGMSCRDVQCQVFTKIDTVGRIPLEVLICVFHGMAVFAHVWALWCKKTYYALLDKKMNPIRWLEYSCSASIMQVVLLVMFGYTDVWLLSMAAVLMGATQVFGHATEQYLHQADLVQKAQKQLKKYVEHTGVDEKAVYAPKSSSEKQALTCCPTCVSKPLKNRIGRFLEKWQFFFAGTITFLPPWVTMYYGFFWSVEHSNPGPPEWVKHLIWSLVATFASFALVMVYYLRNYIDDNISYKSERWYCTLSILSKTLLTWQLYFGVFMRAKRELISC